MNRQFLAVSIGASLLASLPAASQNVQASDPIRAPRWLRSPIDVSVNYSSLGQRYQSGPGISVSKDLWRGLGAEADFSDYFYRGVSFSQPYSNGFSFLLGPRFSVTPGAKGSGRLTLFSHALVGKVRGREYACSYLVAWINGLTIPCMQFNFKTALEIALGSGADVRLSSHFALRVAQIDYVHAFYPSESQRYVRLSAGGVFLLGAVLPMPRVRHARTQEALPAGEFFLAGSKMWTSANQAHFHTHGGGGSITGNFNRYVAAEIELFKYADYSQDPPAYANNYTLLFGPRFAYRRASCVTPFAHVLVGGTRGAQNILPPYPPGVIPNTASALTGRTAFTVGLGGGLDVRAWRFVWIRVLQADYLRESFPHDAQNNLRLSFGITFRFGRLGKTDKH